MLLGVWCLLLIKRCSLRVVGRFLSVFVVRCVRFVVRCVLVVVCCVLFGACCFVCCCLLRRGLLFVV